MTPSADKSLLVVVLDCPLPDTCRSGVAPWVLTLPLGTRSVLDHLAARLADLPARLDGRIFVLPSMPVGGDYKQRLRASTSSSVEVVQPDELAGILGECEPSDDVLLLDAGRWPVGSFDLSAQLRGQADSPAAIHLIAVGAGGECTRERVERDGEGHVKRIQRLYDGALLPEIAAAGVFLSLVPARVMGEIRFGSLTQVRSALSAKGLLSRDVPLALDTMDLRSAEGVLALGGTTVAECLQRGPREGFTLEQSNLLVGRDCRIDTSAQFVGPVILQDGVKVEAGVTMVGPTVVGRGSTIEADTIIAQSLVASHSTVRSGVTLRHCVAAGVCKAGPRDGVAAPMNPGPLLPESVGGTGPRRDLASPHISRRKRRVHLLAKRAMDIVCSALVLLILAPLLVVVAMLIKLASPGPVLFIHRREQKGGKEFPCLKFRTMDARAHEQQRELYKQNEVDGPQFKLRHDPRVNRLGAWLRRTNIDELPQLINVLVGHMSLVGPRPSPFRENQICVPWRRARLSVRPGITGLWQLCRSCDRSAGDFHEWIFYDIAYVRHFTIWLDVKILLATLTSGGRGNIPMSQLVPGIADDVPPSREQLAS